MNKKEELQMYFDLAKEKKITPLEYLSNRIDEIYANCWYKV